jgi:thioredoxin reductase (NADPH)
MTDVLIIGAGTAGLTAAIYARRAEKTVLVLEANSFGGQIVNTPSIENFPAAPHVSGFDFAMRLYEQATALGAEIRFEKALELRDGDPKTVVTAKNEYVAKTVILATGSKNRKLGLSEEERLTGRGVSYCATCDGHFFRGKTVAVVGGGNTALEDALYLSEMASKVYLIHRRDSFRGEEALANRLKEKENAEFVLNSTVTELIAGAKLEAVRVSSADGNERVLPVDGLFVAIGRIPENLAFSPPVQLDEAGYVAAGEDCRTNVPGVFVAGDNRTKTVRQLVTAAGDGAVAALEAVKYLNS